MSANADYIPAHFDVTILLPLDSPHTIESLRDEIQSWLEDLTRGEVIATPTERDHHEQATATQGEESTQDESATLSVSHHTNHVGRYVLIPERRGRKLSARPRTTDLEKD